VEPAPQALIAVLRHSHQRLASLAQAIDKDVLTRPSMSSDWTVAQVFSHLGSGAELALMMLESALRGEPANRDAFAPVWDAWNAKTPQQQAADCLPADEAHISRLESLTEAELAGISVDFAGLKVDASGLIRLRLGEHAVHTWDVAGAIDPAAVVAPDAVDLIVGNLPWLAERTGQPAGPAFRARLRGTSPDVDFLLDVGDKVTMAPWPDDSAGPAAGPVDGEIRMPSEALVRLIYGRLAPARTPPLEITGVPSLLDRVRATFPGF
jgi:uncharacterized protein (TIGR03083 family)